jgi:RES domain-containing protein
LECHDDLFNDLCEAFQETDWVPSADSHWSSSHEHEILGDSWSSFVETITHRTRFFFGNAKLSPDAGPQEYAPRSMLPRLGQLVKSIGLRQVLKAGQVFYRARQRQLEEEWAADSRSMSAPPSHLARAGRMNPAGISYLYLAHDRATAVAEVQPSLSETMFVAKFELTRDVSVLDFSAPPGCPSIFDGDRRRIREALLFLERFVDEICRPVVKDGREHIDYVPSQVVCEYFALVFEADAAGSRVDGIVYPSAVRPGWRNLVLFPTERGPQNSFESIRFLCVED